MNSASNSCSVRNEWEKYPTTVISGSLRNDATKTRNNSFFLNSNKIFTTDSEKKDSEKKALMKTALVLRLILNTTLRIPEEFEK